MRQKRDASWPLNKLTGPAHPTTNTQPVATLAPLSLRPCPQTYSRYRYRYPP